MSITIFFSLLRNHSSFFFFFKKLKKKKKRKEKKKKKKKKKKKRKRYYTQTIHFFVVQYNKNLFYECILLDYISNFYLRVHIHQRLDSVHHDRDHFLKKISQNRLFLNLIH